MCDDHLEQKENVDYGNQGRMNALAWIWQKYTGTDSKRNMIIYISWHIHLYNSIWNIWTSYSSAAIFLCSYNSARKASFLFSSFNSTSFSAFTDLNASQMSFRFFSPSVRKAFSLGEKLFGVGRKWGRTLKKNSLCLPQQTYFHYVGAFLPKSNIPTRWQFLFLKAFCSSESSNSALACCNFKQTWKKKKKKNSRSNDPQQCEYT